MANQTIDTTIFASTHPDLVKRTDVSGVIISCVLFLIGILAFVSIFGLEKHSSIASMLLMVLGTGLFLLGIFWMFWKSRKNIYLPTGSVAKEYSLFFDLAQLDKLTDLVDAGSFLDKEIRSTHEGNVRMDLVVSEDHKFAALQLFQFVSYIYKPVTVVRYFMNEDASNVADFLVKCKLH